MTDKEMRRLRRSELLELLLEQMQENDRLKEELKQKDEELRNRQIIISESGSIAEAALALNGVFEAAQAAAQQYLENVQRLNTDQKTGDQT